MYTTVDKSKLFEAGISKVHARATMDDISTRLERNAFLSFSVAHDVLVQANAANGAGFPFIVMVYGGTTELRTFTAAMLSRLMIALGRSSLHLQASRVFDDKFGEEKLGVVYTDRDLLVIEEFPVDVANKGRFNIFREIVTERLAAMKTTVLTCTSPPSETSDYVVTARHLAGDARCFLINLDKRK